MYQVWSRQDGKDLRLESCRPPFSFYDLVDRLWANAITGHWPLHKFLSLMRVMGATHFVEEEIDIDSQASPPAPCVQELRYERESVARRVGLRPDQMVVEVRRFDFFWANADADWRKLPHEALVGYFVHVAITLPQYDNYRLAYILEAVTRPPVVGAAAADGTVRHEPINRGMYVHCQSTFQTTVGRGADSRDFKITGTFFAQQNRLTHVCAHAAMRIAINSCLYLVNGQKLTNQFINEALGITHAAEDTRIGTFRLPHQDKVTRNRGLTREDISKILEERLGLGIGLLNCKQTADLEFDNFAYPSMESGWPVLIGLEGVNVKNGQQVEHVLTVLGHTLDPFRWSPEARHGYGMLPRSHFMSAVEWTDQFIITDDGYGMHMTLQSDVIRNFIAPHRNASLHVMFVLAIQPKAVTFEGLNATTISEDLVRNFSRELRGRVTLKWLTRLTSARELVCRTFHLTREQYVQSIVPATGAYARAVEELLNTLPETFWLTEFALPALYTANGRKLGDVVVRDDGVVDNQDLEKSFESQWEFIWLPGAAKFRSQERLVEWPITGPVDMVRASGSLLVQ